MKFPEEYRKQLAPPYVSQPGEPYGCFQVPGHKAPGRRTLNIIAVDGLDTDWEHVSVSILDSKQTPTWAEMCFVKDLFWDAGDWVVQYHPAASHYVNHHPGVLHLWRHTKGFPTPPTVCV